MTLRVICSWCQLLLREGSPDAKTSHGCCPSCVAKLNAELDALEAA